jgi:radical SAM protein with 4Fe4S-binding SPASM domain
MASRVPLHSVMRILESPDLVVKSARQAVRKRITSRMDYRRTDGYSAPPIQIDLKIVNACNLRCKMCAQWGEVGYNLTRPSAEIRETVPLSVYKKMVDDIESFKPWIYIWGGEPFLYPDLLPLITYMKKKGFIVSIVTNGTKVAQHARELVEAGLDVLLVSIDGPRDTHDNIRGYKGAFNLTTDGIRAVQAEKERLGKVKPYVTLMSVFTRDNQDKVEEIYELGDELEIDGMLSWYGWYQTPDSGARQTALLQEKMNITPWSWKGYLWSAQEIDPEVVVQSVKRLNERQWSFPYVFFPDLKSEDVPSYYSDHTKTFGYNQCRAPWLMCEIMPNGDVATCRDYPDVVVGNIKQDSILNIWNSQRSRDFRLLLKNDGLMPICSRCQGLMGL